MGEEKEYNIKPLSLNALAALLNNKIEMKRGERVHRLTHGKGNRNFISASSNENEKKLVNKFRNTTPMQDLSIEVVPDEQDWEKFIVPRMGMFALVTRCKVWVQDNKNDDPTLQSVVLLRRVEHAFDPKYEQLAKDREAEAKVAEFV